MENLLTVQEVAEKLKISETTVYQWKAQGILPAVQLSRKALRFREKDINAFIDSKSPQTAAQHCPPSNKPRKKKSISARITGLNDQIQKYVESAKGEVLEYA
jgi:excisionase family DNA binding protein